MLRTVGTPTAASTGVPLRVGPVRNRSHRFAVSLAWWMVPNTRGLRNEYRLSPRVPRSEFAGSNSMVPSDAGGVTLAPTPALANQ